MIYPRHTAVATLIIQLPYSSLSSHCHVHLVYCDHLNLLLFIFLYTDALFPSLQGKSLRPPSSLHPSLCKVLSIVGAQCVHTYVCICLYILIDCQLVVYIHSHRVGSFCFIH